jgi:methionine biosynthesis protein MetW
VDEGSRVLDLGCGDGALFRDLRRERGITGMGVEIDEEKIVRCVGNGVPVLQADIDRGLNDFKSGSFDYVILNRTLQTLKRPEFVIDEMLRVGRKAIVGFPNFGYIGIRLSLLLRGRMPVTENLPYHWYDSPNIHLCTVADFHDMCRRKAIAILDAFFLRGERANAVISAMPNVHATEAVFLIAKSGGKAKQ